MQVRYSADPVRFSRMTTQEVRDEFLIDTLFQPDSIEMIYSDIDRAITGSVVPAKKTLSLSAADELRADFFCQRRELGVLNIGQAGTVTVDGTDYAMANKDGLYIGRGSKDISFSSDNSKDPAKFYLLSYPAHADYPTTHVKMSEAEPVELGTIEASNKRTIYKLIHPAGAKSCQLVMGFTELAPGCVWNTMPPHTHERRMEVYMYFDITEDTRVFHLMGKPDETRHIVVADGQAVISPNQAFDDMDHLTIDKLR